MRRYLQQNQDQDEQSSASTGRSWEDRKERRRFGPDVLSMGRKTIMECKSIRGRKHGQAVLRQPKPVAAGLNCAFLFWQDNMVKANIDKKFSAHYDAVEAELKSSTVGEHLWKIHRRHHHGKKTNEWSVNTNLQFLSLHLFISFVFKCLR